MRKSRTRKDALSKLASIQYAGVGGSSADCQGAVIRFLQHDRINLCRIPSWEGAHCLLLTINSGDLVAIKSGFRSGYGGEGPHTFSYALQLLEAHNIEIEEFDVDEDFLERVDASALTTADLEQLESSRRVRQRSSRDYILEQHWLQAERRTLWREFPKIIPFGVIEPRLIDLALTFWDAPDERLLVAFRKLEDIVRDRTGLREHGSKLFAQAFLGDKAVSGWPGLDESEQIGRAQLFIGTYQAHRNPRAHRQPKEWTDSQLCELLLLNQLYRLEAQTIIRSGPPLTLQGVKSR